MPRETSSPSVANSTPAPVLAEESEPNSLQRFAGFKTADAMAEWLELFDTIETPLPTMGGSQYWTDQFICHQWRIQKNVFTGHCRLLGDGNLRHAFGTYDHCKQEFERLKHEKQIPEMTGKVLVAVHGLGSTRLLMRPLLAELEEKGGYTVILFEYASMQGTIAEHADALAGVMKHLNKAEQIDFLAHSMGNIVIRRYMADQMKTRPDRRIDPRIKRFVMLAPPNHGSRLSSDWAHENELIGAIVGKAGIQLGDEWRELEKTLVTPPCEFGIIAGGAGNDYGLNPGLPGDNDGILTVATTRLAGASDFLLVPLLHPAMQMDPRIAQPTLNFLEHGHFCSEEARRPIPHPQKAPLNARRQPVSPWQMPSPPSAYE